MLAIKSDFTYDVKMIKIVMDTNVFVSALRSEGGASRQVLRALFNRRCRGLLSNTLWTEYEDLLGRSVWTDVTTAQEREILLATFAANCDWVKLYYSWRPNLKDEGDNFLIELAVAGGADAIVTYNVKDFKRSELQWTHLKIMTPQQCLETLK